MKTLGFIGLGNIGGAMSQNLLARGFDVIGFDLVKNEQFIAAGGRFADSIQQVGSEATVILQSLPTSNAVSNSVDALSGVARQGQVLIDISSYELTEKLANAERLAEAGMTLLDCEISGLPFMVANRSAVVFQSGDKQVIDAMSDVFAAMTDHRFYLGDFGAATKMKLFANAMVAIHNGVAAEVLNLAALSGIDPNLLLQVLPKSAAGSSTFANKAPIMISREFDNGAGPFSHMFHYLARVSELAAEVGANTPILNTTRQLYQTAEHEERGNQDIAALIEIIEAENQNTGNGS